MRAPLAVDLVAFGGFAVFAAPQLGDDLTLGALYRLLVVGMAAVLVGQFGLVALGRWARGGRRPGTRLPM